MTDLNTQIATLKQELFQKDERINVLAAHQKATKLFADELMNVNISLRTNNELGQQQIQKIMIENNELKEKAAASELIEA